MKRIFKVSLLSIMIGIFLFLFWFAFPFMKLGTTVLIDSLNPHPIVKAVIKSYLNDKYKNVEIKGYSYDGISRNDIMVAEVESKDKSFQVYYDMKNKEILLDEAKLQNGELKFRNLKNDKAQKNLIYIYEKKMKQDTFAKPFAKSVIESELLMKNIETLDLALEKEYGHYEKIRKDI